VNKGFKQLIYSIAKVAAESQEAGNMAPARFTIHKKKGSYALFKKRLKVALGCMAIISQSEETKRRAQLIRRAKYALEFLALIRRLYKPRKPWLLGNEHHTNFPGITDVM